MLAGTHPIFTCAEARDFEARHFGGEEAREWPAMQRAGRAIAATVQRDFEELGGFPADGRMLVLVGKGHNGGDALIAAHAFLEKYPAARADVVFAFGERALRPLARRAWRELVHAAPGRVIQLRTLASPAAGECADHGCGARAGYALSLDGIFGFQFRAPVPENVAALFAQVAACDIRFRAAVDLPSGLSDENRHDDPVLRADFTYATGSVKNAVVNGLSAGWVGRLRYLDLGFFASEVGESRLRILTPAVLASLARLRAPKTDKRDYGHVFVLGGSRNFPGAVFMTVLAALRSGAGLVTAFVPESLAAVFAAQAPEAMWVGWPETPDGGLALEGQHLLSSRLERASALVLGPGLAREAETMTLVREIVTHSPVPVVLDADALQPEIVRAGNAPRILTPHLGELRRILAGGDFYTTPAGSEAVVVVKGPTTCVTSESGRAGYYSPFGGPVLARGGSGDLLAGIAGTLLAQSPQDPLRAAAQAVVWQGLAADALAQAHGQAAVRATQLLDYLSAALRSAEINSPARHEACYDHE